MPDAPVSETPQHRQRINLLVLAVAIFLAGALFLVVMHIKSGVLPQNCHMAGFRSCTGDGPVLTPRYRRARLE